jgi:hypothetical protein
MLCSRLVQDFEVASLDHFHVATRYQTRYRWQHGIARNDKARSKPGFVVDSYGVADGELARHKKTHTNQGITKT